jgi:hypothetical protein
MKRKPFVTTSSSSSSIAEVVEEQTQQKKKQISSHFSSSSSSSSPSSFSSPSFLSRSILTALWSLVAISALLYAPLAIETLFYVFTDYDSHSSSSHPPPNSRRRSLRLVTLVLEIAGGKKYATGEGSVEHEQTETYLLMRSWLFLHTISSSIAIVIGPFQITDVIRKKLMKRSPEIHRALGQVTSSSYFFLFYSFLSLSFLSFFLFPLLWSLLNFPSPCSCSLFPLPPCSSSSSSCSSFFTTSFLSSSLLFFFFILPSFRRSTFFVWD